MSTPAAPASPSMKIFEWNNLAVTYLMEGKVEQARRLLFDAFQETSHQVRVAAQSSSSTRTEELHGDINAAIVANRFTPPTLPRDCLLMTIQGAFSSTVAVGGATNHGDCDQRHPRTQALMMAMPEDYAISHAAANWTLVSAFVIYNLGIVYLESYESASRRCCSSVTMAEGLSAGDSSAAPLLDDGNEFLLYKSQMLFASAKALLLQATRTSTLAPTGNPLVDLMTLLTQFKLVETASRTLALKEGQEHSTNRASTELEENIRGLLNLVSRMEFTLYHSSPSCYYYNDVDVSKLLRTACQEVIVQCSMLQQEEQQSPFLSAMAAGAA
eukprot:CAMPEP_0117035736 /NCGR_PEP_ID=MMETSP0472-20121206/25364_1 /TAXON_ID=693140 ORGANISM="Tiarina fusus, Strain LIS" /NCGR_SAMPLE_ID=MMETSP0472 /ASSEMBLY_ACC=CAM_ASM_000603 /LENGTH=327 /DNA_ID=CAMNT_0004745299 /DNA_START=53 /DNA_END=1036 /DNA_ORIENTATION=+